VLFMTATRTFPFSHPHGYVSLRDAKGEEVGVIRDLSELPREARELIEEELDRRYLQPRITHIENVRERFGGVEWEVETDRGPRRIITKRVHDTLAEITPAATC